MKRKLIFLSIAGIAICGTTFAQTTAVHTIGITVPAVMIMDLKGGTSINLAFSAPTVPGEPVVSSAQNSSLWLNYSYIQTSSSSKAKIQATISGVPEGYTITVKPAAPSSDGSGDKGLQEANAVNLSTTPANIITNIGSSYTGGGLEKGHNLLYTATFSAYNKLITSTSELATVTYTISEN